MSSFVRNNRGCIINGREELSGESAGTLEDPSVAWAYNFDSSSSKFSKRAWSTQVELIATPSLETMRDYDDLVCPAEKNERNQVVWGYWEQKDDCDSHDHHDTWQGDSVHILHRSGCQTRVANKGQVDKHQTRRKGVEKKKALKMRSSSERASLVESTKPQFSILEST